MGLRVEIQKQLLTLFKAGPFPGVTYDVSGVPTAGASVTPSVICNEVSSAIIAKATGTGIGYDFSGWSFQVICEFVQEIDYSDFILTKLQDLCFTSGQIMVTAHVGSSIVVKHPPRQGALTGTILEFNFNIKTRR